jgi:hypothetical protein
MRFWKPYSEAISGSLELVQKSGSGEIRNLFGAAFMENRFTGNRIGDEISRNKLYR